MREIGQMWGLSDKLWKMSKQNWLVGFVLILYIFEKLRICIFQIYMYITLCWAKICPFWHVRERCIQLIRKNVNIELSVSIKWQQNCKYLTPPHTCPWHRHQEIVSSQLHFYITFLQLITYAPPWQKWGGYEAKCGFSCSIGQVSNIKEGWVSVSYLTY